MEADSRRELETTLNYLETLSKDPEKLKKTMYDSLTAVSFLTLEAKKAKFKKGWATTLVDRHDDLLFDKKEALIVEQLMNTVIRPVFDNEESQNGGAVSLNPSTSGSMISRIVPTVNPDDISLDKTYVKVKNYLAGLDAQAYTLSRELGPFKFFYDMQADIRIPIPTPAGAPILVPISPRAIPVMIAAFVEAIRLLMSFGPLSNGLARKILSLILALIDLLQGQWKNAILSLAGALGEFPMVVGIVGKLALNAFALISPDLQDKFLHNLFKSGKSMFVGFFLWSFSTFAPDFVRLIVRKQFDMIDKMVQDARGKIKKLEESMQKSVGPMLQIKFQDIPEGSIPSFDDIQNLQSIAGQKEIFCSKEFQEIIEPLKSAPPARIMLELFNIPTEPELVALECGAMAGASIDSTVEKLLTPQITLAPGALPKPPALPLAAPLAVAKPVAAPVAVAKPVAAPVAVAKPVAAPVAVAKPVAAPVAAPVAVAKPVAAPVAPPVAAPVAPLIKKGGTRSTNKKKKRTRKLRTAKCQS